MAQMVMANERKARMDSFRNDRATDSTTASSGTQQNRDTFETSDSLITNDAELQYSCMDAIDDLLLEEHRLSYDYSPDEFSEVTPTTSKTHAACKSNQKGYEKGPVFAPVQEVDYVIYEYLDSGSESESEDFIPGLENAVLEDEYVLTSTAKGRTSTGECRTQLDGKVPRSIRGLEKKVAMYSGPQSTDLSSSPAGNEALVDDASDPDFPKRTKFGPIPGGHKDIRKMSKTKGSQTSHDEAAPVVRLSGAPSLAIRKILRSLPRDETELVPTRPVSVPPTSRYVRAARREPRCITR